MNFFVEGLQGSGKSTMVRKLSEFNPDYTAVREGEYSPVELSWCAYVNGDQYKEILNRYPGLRSTDTPGCVRRLRKKHIPKATERSSAIRRSPRTTGCFIRTLNSMRSIITVFPSMISGRSFWNVTENGFRIK